MTLQKPKSLHKCTPEIVRELAIKNLTSYIPYISPTYKAPLHLQEFTRHLDDIAIRKMTKKLVVSTPPQHYKTESLMHFIPLYLEHRPEMTAAYASYSYRQAYSKMKKCFDYVHTAQIPFNNRFNSVDEFRTIEGGGFLTTSIEGQFTGQRADLIIIDDPLKDRLEADSRIIRDNIRNWFTDVVELRMRPEASIVIVMTRWHPQDLIGELIKTRNDFEIVRIPALCDNLDTIGKKEKKDYLNRDFETALLPEIFPTEYLKKVKEDKPYTFSAMYQGLPRTRDSQIFKDAYYFDTMPEHYRLYVGVDLAYSEKRRADFTAVTVLAKNEKFKYILYAERWQKDIHYTKQRLKELQLKYNVPFGVEANGTQLGIYDIIKKEIKAKPLQPKGDKYARSQETADDWNTGQILIPRNAEWTNDFLEEINEFTGVKDTHDDYVDSLVYANEQTKYLQPSFS